MEAVGPPRDAATLGGTSGLEKAAAVWCTNQLHHTDLAASEAIHHIFPYQINHTFHMPKSPECYLKRPFSYLSGRPSCFVPPVQNLCGVLVVVQVQLCLNPGTLMPSEEPSGMQSMGPLQDQGVAELEMLRNQQPNSTTTLCRLVGYTVQVEHPGVAGSIGELLWRLGHQGSEHRGDVKAMDC